MNEFAFVIPYYRNPLMLEIQVANWNSYHRSWRDRVRVILIDDCSPEPAEPILKKCTLKTSLYRVDIDRPWGQHAARNLGAKVIGKDEAWGLYTDMDILMPGYSVEEMLELEWDPNKHYTFRRIFKDKRSPKIHCNSFLVQRGPYWRAGGYDEAFTGTYGGDGIFLRALERQVPAEHWDCIELIGYNDTVPDCSTRDWGRQLTKWHREYLRRRDEKRRGPNGLKPDPPLQFPWHKVW